MDPVDSMTARLRGDLKAAMQGKRTVEVKVLRTLLGAIDNAQAVPVAEPRGYVSRAFGDASDEVPRLALSAEDIQAIFAREAESCRAAAAAIAPFGQADRAAALEAEAAIIDLYLAV
jgi:uncharacterized protein YqeY